MTTSNLKPDRLLEGSSWIDWASPVGDLRLVRSGERLRAIWFCDAKHCRPAGPNSRGDEAGFQVAMDQLTEYFAGKRKSFDLELEPIGTEFQQRVWSRLRAIPYGETLSYAELAEAIGQPTAIRAVASANARNPLSILIPCHRVVGSDGRLTGYAGGVENKRRLLDLESGEGLFSPRPS